MDVQFCFPCRCVSCYLSCARKTANQAGSSGLAWKPSDDLSLRQQDEIDPAVIRRVAEGDCAAFERLYDAFSGILYSLALRMLDRPEDTEELIQEVFTKIWSDAVNYDPRRGAPLAWAITITRHKAIDKIEPRPGACAV